MRARAASLLAVLAVAACATGGRAAAGSGTVANPYRVVTMNSPPFAFNSTGVWQGMSIDLIKQICGDNGWVCEIHGSGSVTQLLSEVQLGSADMGIASITKTEEREASVEFSHTYYLSGLSILARKPEKRSALAVMVDVITSGQLLSTFCALWVCIFVMSNIFWICEVKSNPRIPDDYLDGIWVSVWWSIVTVTTVGFGDVVAVTRLGRTVSIMWICVSLVVMSVMGGSVASALTVEELANPISGPSDLRDHSVSAPPGSTAAQKAVSLGAVVYGAPLSECFYKLIGGEVDAMMYDLPSLQYRLLVDEEFSSKTEIVGGRLNDEPYGVAFPRYSPLRETVNRDVLRKLLSGNITGLEEQWFGSSSVGAAVASDPTVSGADETTVLDLFSYLAVAILAAYAVFFAVVWTWEWWSKRAARKRGDAAADGAGAAGGSGGADPPTGEAGKGGSRLQRRMTARVVQRSARGAEDGDGVKMVGLKRRETASAPHGGGGSGGGGSSFVNPASAMGGSNPLVAQALARRMGEAAVRVDSLGERVRAMEHKVQALARLLDSSA